METFHLIQRVGAHPEKGERYYLVLEGLTRVQAEALMALIVDVSATQGRTLVEGISDRTWQRVLKNMEEFNGIPAFRLPRTTHEEAQNALKAVRAKFSLCNVTDPQVFDLIAQRPKSN